MNYLSNEEGESFWMEAWQTIADVKAHVATETGWMPQQQAILWNHSEIADTLELKDVDQEHLDRLHFLVVLPEPRIDS